MSFKLKYFFAIFWMGFISFAQFNNYNVGDTVHNFTVTDTDGQTYTLYDILNQGKYVYIDFFATNCGTCQTKTPIFNAFYDKYGCNAGDVFCISIEVANHNNAEVVAFEQQYGGTTHRAPAVSVDGGAASVATDFGIGSYPIICAIDPTKKLIVENVVPVQDVYDIAQSFPQNFNPPVMSCTSGIEVSQLGFIDVFPIPVHHRIHITTSKSRMMHIRIFNLNGMEVYSQKFNNAKDSQIDLNLENGVYLLELQTIKAIQYRKIVVIN